MFRRLAVKAKEINLYEVGILLLISSVIYIEYQSKTISLEDNPECKVLQCQKGRDGKVIVIQMDYYNPVKLID